MICKDQAIVLKTRDFRETSKIAVFYSKKFGKISGLLKGIRTEPKKFASNLDFLSINEVIFYKKRFSELHLISQCDLIKNFNSLKSDIAKFTLSGFCSELIDSIMPSENAHPEIYELLLNFLYSLENNNSAQNLIYNFIIKTLSLSGFQPHLESCVACHRHIKRHAFFSNRLGGLLCDKCFKEDRKSEDILAGTVASILFFQKTSWLHSLRLSIGPSIERQLNRIIFSFLDFNLERKFKSLKILNEDFKSIKSM